MTVLLDTCILVDFLRGRAPAVNFLQGIEAPPAISVITIMELTAGVKGKKEEAQIAELFSALSVHDVTPEVAKAAGVYLGKYARSHSVDPPDALIAATAELHELELVTQNIKHFPMFNGLKRPYKT